MSDVYALEVQTLFRGVTIASKRVLRAGARRRGAPLFVVGSTARADAPVAPDYLGAAAPGDRPGETSHPLVTGAAGDGHYAVCLAPRMTGTLARGNGLAVGAPIRAAAGPDFLLGPGDRARVECGAVTFLLESMPCAATIPAPRFGAGWRSAEARYHLGSALAVTVALLALLAVPEDPRTLALDLLARDHIWAPVLIKPPVVPPVPLPSADHTAEGGGPAGAPAREAAGQAGSETARATHRRAAASGRTIASLIPRTSPTPAEISRMGILPQLSQATAARAIFARDSPFGDNPEDVLGDLSTGPTGPAFGNGGLTVLGTGPGGAGEHEGTIGGTGTLNTLGKASGGNGDGWRHGDQLAQLTRHRTRGPEVILSPPVVKGGLDREIIRRIIRRHLNEVKFCYEQALVTQPGLGGRVLVRFAIAPAGQVLSSVVESSTLGNPRVELCTAQAVRRWEFPKPTGGGMVMVSYPFVLTPAGAGS